MKSAGSIGGICEGEGEDSKGFIRTKAVLILKTKNKLHIRMDLDKYSEEKFYPDIYLPVEVDGLMRDTLNKVKKAYVDEFEPTEPIKPPGKVKIHDNILIEYLAVPIVLGIFGGLFFFNMIGFFIGAIIGIILIFYEKKSDKKKEKIYEQKLKKYKVEKEKFEKSKKYYEEKKEEFEINEKSREWLLKQRKKMIRSTFSFAETANKKIDNKRGSSEEYFEKYLNKYFPECIYTNRAIELFKIKSQSYNNFEETPLFRETRAYIPDFYLKINSIPLNIDIEIDEPYTYDGKLIHLSNDKNESLRNIYFTNKYWMVIRFSEKQILKEPESCCKAIASVIFELTGCSKYLDNLKNNKPITIEKRWDRNESKELKDKNIRLNYKKHKNKKFINKWDLAYFLENNWENKKYIIENTEYKSNNNIYLNTKIVKKSFTNNIILENTSNVYKIDHYNRLIYIMKDGVDRFKIIINYISKFNAYIYIVKYSEYSILKLIK